MEGNIPAASGPHGRDSRASLSMLASWARDLTISVVLALIVILFLYQPVKVEGTSMMPALTDQERIFINKFVYKLGLSEVGRGDMVVFWYPSDPSKSFIKRVIGLPGDTIEMEQGTVYVNGEPLQEHYVLDEYRDPYSMAAVQVPEDSYFVLGDHRSSSSDSRNWGAVPRRFIYGKAVFVYWPLDKLGLLN
jgi:signal peptidase I